MPSIEVYQMQENGKIPDKLWERYHSIAHFFNTDLCGCLGEGDMVFVSEDSNFPFLVGHPPAQQQYIEKFLQPNRIYHPNTFQMFRDPPGWIGSYWISSDEHDDNVQFYFFIADFKGIYLQWGNA